MLSLEFHPSLISEVKEAYSGWAIFSEGIKRLGITAVDANCYTMLIIKEKAL